MEDVLLQQIFVRLCANADFVMLGGMLAGTDGCEGNWKYNMHRKESLQFYGMSSKQAMNKHNGGVANIELVKANALQYHIKAKQQLQYRIF